MKAKRETIGQRDEDGLIASRKEKLRKIRGAGFNPYRNDFLPKHKIVRVQQIASGLSAPESPSMQPLIEDRFRIGGRVVELRSFGKASFAKMRDSSGKQQVYFRQDILGDREYDLFKLVELWDFAATEGYLFFTKTGELTLMVERFALLAKALRPPPAKWEGLRDREIRYRRRYVDLVANPDVAETFRRRGELIRVLRFLLDKEGFLEVETPILHPIMGGAAARPFLTHHNSLNMPLYLRIAPELYLKRLVVGGYDRVYEIGRNFRNEGISRFHSPEFTMLEFYMGYATCDDMMGFVEKVLLEVARPYMSGETISYQGQTIDLTPPWPKVPVEELVLMAGSKLKHPLESRDLQDLGLLQNWIEANGLEKRDDELSNALSSAETLGGKIGAIFEHLGESQIDQSRPVFVLDYPRELSPFARSKDNDPDLADRFELFMAGRELVNAFSELNDPQEQRRRLFHQAERRKAGELEAMDHDEDYCRALEYGMPPTAGAGIGIDRLAMILLDQPSIRDVLLFPLMRQEKKQ